MKFYLVTQFFQKDSQEWWFVAKEASQFFHPVNIRLNQSSFLFISTLIVSVSITELDQLEQERLLANMCLCLRGNREEVCKRANCNHLAAD